MCSVRPCPGDKARPLMDGLCDCQVSGKTTECSHDPADSIRRACASLQMTRTYLILRICCRWANQ